MNYPLIRVFVFKFIKIKFSFVQSFFCYQLRLENKFSIRHGDELEIPVMSLRPITSKKIIKKILDGKRLVIDVVNRVPESPFTRKTNRGNPEREGYHFSIHPTMK